MSEVIKKLSDREKAREKLPIWYGSRDNFTHGANETIINARDVINKFSDGIGNITVELFDDLQTVKVTDDGIGMPIMGETDGVKNYVLLLETLFAGQNYDNAEENINAGGTNGVGSTTLNATSDFYEVTVRRDGKTYIVKYKDGGIFQSYEEFDGCDMSHGTTVLFKLDPTMYSKVIYDPDYFKDFLNKVSSTTSEIKYTFKHGDEISEYLYKSKLEYVKENVKNTLSEYVEIESNQYVTETKVKQKVLNEETGEVEEIEKIIKQIDKHYAVVSLSAEPMQETYLNGIYLKDGGYILDGVILGLKKVFKKENPKIKFTDDDIKMSFNIYATVDSNIPEYKGQTKFSTENVTYRKNMIEHIVNKFEIVKQENPKLFKQMFEHVIQINKFNTKSNESISKMKKALKDKNINFMNRVKKFVDCRTKNITKRELYIVEGDSALGSCKLGRNAEFQGIMPVRGKILNCLKADYNQVFKSEVITDLLKVLGCGVEISNKNNKDLNSFDINSLKWSKIIICTDADVDGYQIRTLILTMLYRLAPTLIREGKIFIAETPLFEINTKDKTYFAYDEKEKKIIIESLDNKKYTIQRSKGLGENSPDMMWETTMNPETRRLICVNMQDAKFAENMFELMLGEKVPPRRQYIEENGEKYIEELDVQ